MPESLGRLNRISPSGSCHTGRGDVQVIYMRQPPRLFSLVVWLIAGVLLMEPFQIPCDWLLLRFFRELIDSFPIFFGGSE